MKKSLVFIAFLIVLMGTFSSLSGVVVWTVPGTHPTLGGASGAIAALNAVGALADSYVIDVSPGYNEVLTARLDITATGTPAYSITIKKAIPGANPKLWSYVGSGTPGSAIPDGMVALRGCDYVTIDGIDLWDTNVTNPATMEYGYGLFKTGPTDGAQNNTIQNCKVELNRNNWASGSSPMVEGSVCILVINSTAVLATTAITPTAASGTNSYNKFYTNYLTNANYGIAFSGYNAPSPFTLGDTGNDAGGSASSTGNSIINFGGGTGSTQPSAAIRGNNQWGWNASYNTINNNDGGGVNHAYTFRGIYAQAGTSASCNINYNDISMKCAADVRLFTAIECAIGNTPAGNTVNINNNNIHDCTYSTATTGAFNGITCTSYCSVLNMNYNVVANCSLAGTGAWTGIFASSIAPTTSMNYCQVYNNTKTGASGTMTCCKGTTPLAYGSCTFTNNLIHDNTMPNTSGATATILYGYINNSPVGPTQEIYTNNQIYNLSIGGTNTNALTSTIQGIFTSTVAGANKTTSNNQIYGLQYAAAGTATVYGIQQNSGNNEIAKNYIFNLSAAGSASTVAGIYVASGTTVTTHNNMIFGLSAAGSTSTVTPAAVIGIRIISGTTNNIYYNSVLLNSSGANPYFSSACLYLDNMADIINNIFVNKSTPGASGVAAAIWSTRPTAPYWVGASSNNNIYYTIALPDAAHPIGYLGGVSYPTLANYKAAVATPDQGSYTENVPFQSPTNLHINPAILTLVESNAVPILPTYNSDIDGEARNPGTPDIGADEGNFAEWDSVPVELSSFTAILSAENYVNLNWVTQSETGVQGYYIYRSNTEELEDAQIVSPMINATNSSDQHSYQFTDSELDGDGTYCYWLQNIDFGGTMDFHGPVSVYYSTTGSDPTPEIPVITELKDVYPNPFNPTAFIPYSIAITADVSIRIYNSRGQLLRNFDLGSKLPGNYQVVWNGKDSQGNNCGNGVYYIVMNAGKSSFERKAILMK
jgi:hypothetical protein